VILSAMIATLSLLAATQVFVPAPRSTGAAAVTGASVLSALLAAPYAVFAELPPLEDLPLNEIAPVRTYGSNGLESTDGGQIGLPFQTYSIAFVVAVGWAFTVVNTLKPAKEEDGSYKTYVGGGMLPPDGYTNPLDPRVQEDETEEDDVIYGGKDSSGGGKSASSAVV